jgi:hypothetical protein
MPTPADSTEPDVASFDGQLLLQEDAGGLAVTLRVTESRVTLRSGRSELGAWSASGVSITSAGGGRYEFIAEGDQLIFVPDEAEPFGANPLISALAPLPPTKRWGIRKPKAVAPVEASPAPMFAADEPKRKAGIRRSRPKSEAKEEEPAPQHAADKPKRRVKIRRIKPKSMDAPLPEQPVAAPAPKPDHPIAPRAAEVSSDLRPASAGRILSRRRQAWLATIDQARQYDLFGLDRVPVTQKMRQGHTHKHTWDHRVSAGFASRHICTICGKVRISSR